MFDFNAPIDRRDSFSEKWSKYPKDILPLWVADSDYPTAPAVIEALQRRVAHGVFGYTNQPTAEVQAAIVQHLAQRHQWMIAPEWIVPLNSVVSGLTLSCLCTDKANAEVLTPSTIYPPFNYVCHNTDRQVLPVPLAYVDEHWIIDIAALEQAITPATQLLLFCNPQNPGGAVYSHAELTAIHALCERHNLLICSDEIHCDLILHENKTHIPLATLNEDAANRTITLMSASKTYNIAGLGFSFAIIPNPTLRDQFKRLARERMPEVNVLGQTATAAALKHGEPWRQAQLTHLRENRDYLQAALAELPALKMYPLEATFLAWIDVSALQLDDAGAFFEAAGVGISTGASFGDERFIRLNFACAKTTLEEAVKRIRNAVERLE